jgi:hypothetical protein
VSRRWLLLLGICAALLALLVLLDRWPDPPEAGGGRSGAPLRALPGLRRHQLTSVRLEPRDQQPLVLRRLDDGSGWRLEGGAAARQALVDELLSAVEFLAPSRPVAGARRADADPPAWRLVLRGPAGDRTLVLGPIDLSGQGQHARADGRPLVVPASFGRLLQRLTRRLRRAPDAAAAG